MISQRPDKREQLYQVSVIDKIHGVLPVGPAASEKFVSGIAELIQHKIKTGEITGWSNPCILPVIK